MELIKKHFCFFIIISALIAGLFNILPSLLIWHNLSDSGGNFLLMQQNTYRDEFFQYVPRAREIYDGHFPPTGIYADESGSSPLNPITSLLFSLFLFVFNGNMNWAYLSAQFFFSSVIFLLFYFLGQILFRSRKFSLFFALVGVSTQITQLFFRYYDRDYLGIMLKKFIPIVRTPISKLYFARMDDPMITFPILLAALIFLYLFWIRPKISTAMLAGFFSGLLAYTYLHYWLFVMAFIFALFLCTLFFYRKDKNRIKQCVFLCLTIFLVLIPYFLNYLHFNSSEYGGDYAFRLGKETNRFLFFEYLKGSLGWTLIVNHIIYLAVLLLIYLFYFRSGRRTDKGIFLLGLTMAMFFVWQIPLFLGFGFALNHFNKPISLAVFIILFSIGLEIFKYIELRNRAAGKLIVFFSVLLALSLSAKQAINASLFWEPQPDQLQAYNFPEDLTFSWNWIDSNNIKEPKIVSDSIITSLYLASYTSAKPYLATGFLSPLTDAELGNRFLISNKLFNVSNEVLADRMAEYFGEDCSKISCFKDAGINADKSMWYLLSASLGKSKFNLDSQKVSEHYDYMVPNWMETSSDYVYYGPWEKQFSYADMQKDKNLKLVFKNPSVEIFSIARD